MSRPCGLCSLPGRKAIEERVLRGESIRLVAADARGLSESAIARHMRNHVSPAIREELRSGTAQLHVSDFARRLLDLADETSAVRSHAHSTKDHRLLLQAVSSERDTLGVLMGRLGIDTEEILGGVEMGRTFIRAMLAVLPRYPDVAREFAAFFASEDLNSFADDLRIFADKAERYLETKQKEPLP